MQAPTDERRVLERERAELPAHVTAYRRELDATPFEAQERRSRLEWHIRRVEKRMAEVHARLTGLGQEVAMGDVACPLTFEDRQALLSHPTLPPALRAILEDRGRTIELAHGYELEWPEAEARSLLAHAESHDLAVARALRQELAGLDVRKRE
jgi:hypothetical protein